MARLAITLKEISLLSIITRYNVRAVHWGEGMISIFGVFSTHLQGYLYYTGDYHGVQ